MADRGGGVNHAPSVLARVVDRSCDRAPVGYEALHEHRERCSVDQRAIDQLQRDLLPRRFRTESRHGLFDHPSGIGGGTFVEAAGGNALIPIRLAVLLRFVHGAQVNRRERVDGAEILDERARRGTVATDERNEFQCRPLAKRSTEADAQRGYRPP